MSLNSMPGQEGGWYIMIIISEGCWRFIISRLQITVTSHNCKFGYLGFTVANIPSQKGLPQTYK